MREVRPEDVAATVTLDIPAKFMAEVVIDKDGNRSIKRFIISPWESFAGYFGEKTTAEDVKIGPAGPIFATTSDDAQRVFAWMARGYWVNANDGTWPLDQIDWKE